MKILLINQAVVKNLGLSKRAASSLGFVIKSTLKQLSSLVLIGMSLALNAPVSFAQNGRVTAVEVYEVNPVKLASSTEFEGTVIPFRYTTVRAASAGYVEKILVEDGDQISAQQNLIYIDKVLNESRYNLAKNQLENALYDVYLSETNLKSVAFNYQSSAKQRDIGYEQWQNEQQLFGQGMSSKIRLDQAEANYQALEAQFQAIKGQLNGAEVKAVLELEIQAEAKQALALNPDIAMLKLQLADKTLPVSLAKALAGFNAAQSNYQLARNNYLRSLGQAPFKGQVLRTLVVDGQYVSPGDGLFVIGDTSKFEINLSLTASDVQRISAETKVTVEIDSLPFEQFTGRVKSVAQDADPANRGYDTVVEIDRQNHQILSGDRARVSLQLYDLSNQIVLPLSAILQDLDATYVFTVENDKATKQAVTVGLVLEQQVQISSGLKVGDKVVVRSQQFLKENDPVAIR